MDEICRHCQTPFPLTHPSGTRYGTRYCCPARKADACKRVCPQCERVFDAPLPSSRKAHCSPECFRAAQTTGYATSLATRTERARVLVVCNWGGCPRPHDLLTLARSTAKRPSECRHDECKIAYRQACNGGKKLPKGDFATCQVCDTSVGYRSRRALEAGGIYCVRCVGRRGRKRPRMGKGEMRPCGLVGCTNGVWVTPFKLKYSKTNIFGCCKAHSYAARRTSPHLRCVTCGYEQSFQAVHAPPNLDALATDWQCRACRPHSTAVRSFECAQCHGTFSRRIILARPAAERRFCTLACRHEYYRLRRPHCLRCNNVITRRGRGQKLYCSRDCSAAAARGQPHPHTRPSIAEEKIVEQWRAGVRGIKKLAKMSGACTNTVRKVQRGGRLSVA